MGRKITVELSESSWLFLSEIQFEEKKKGVKAKSLSKMVSEIVDQKLEEQKKASQN